MIFLDKPGYSLAYSHILNGPVRETINQVRLADLNSKTQCLATWGSTFRLKPEQMNDASKIRGFFVKAFTDGDAEGCAKLYTEDTIYMQAELPIEKGREVVLDGYKKFFKSRTNKIIEVSEPIKEVISFGDMAVIRGTGKNIEETPQGVRIIKTYKYMILSEKQKDGSWQMKWDIYNFDADYKN